MSRLNAEVIEKLMEAKRLEKEALMMLVPEKMKGHLEVICGELQAMALELLLEAQKSPSTQEEKSEKVEKSEKAEKSSSSTKVKKVPIG